MIWFWLAFLSLALCGIGAAWDKVFLAVIGQVISAVLLFLLWGCFI